MAYLLLYSYEAHCIKKNFSKTERKRIKKSSLISLSDILLIFCHSITHISMKTYNVCILLNTRLRILMEHARYIVYQYKFDSFVSIYIFVYILWVWTCIGMNCMYIQPITSYWSGTANTFGICWDSCCSDLIVVQHVFIIREPVLYFVVFFYWFDIGSSLT